MRACATSSRCSTSARAGRRRRGAGLGGRLTTSKIRSTSRRSGSPAPPAPPARRSSPLAPSAVRADGDDGELEAGLERRLELADEAVAAGADAAALQVAARPVGAHGGDERGPRGRCRPRPRRRAVGAVDRPAGDAVGAQHVDDAVDARAERRGVRARPERAVRARAAWRSPGWTAYRFVKGRGLTRCQWRAGRARGTAANCDLIC